MKQYTLFLSKVSLLAVAMTAVVGCQIENDEIRDLAAQYSVTENPLEGRYLPAVDDPKVQLGKKLFFSKALSGDLDTACASCHHPMLGGGDALPLPIGVNAQYPDVLGPGRLHSDQGFDFDGGPTVPRNSPTTFNIGMWDKVMFWDGRVESFGGTPLMHGDDGEGIFTPDSGRESPDMSALNLSQVQATFPVTSNEEMRAHFADGVSNQELRQALLDRLINQEIPNTWQQEFEAVYGVASPIEELITFERITDAIAAYEQSQVFVNNPWFQFMAGDDEALDASAKAGAKLFFTSVEEGGAGCASCHSGNLFSDEGFHALAMPQVGRGKGIEDHESDDWGRAMTTQEENDKYRFRTPTLLNVTETAPYTHAGAYLSLENVIRHHLDPVSAVANYDSARTDLQPGMQMEHCEENTVAALAAFERDVASGEIPWQPVELNDIEVGNLIAFLEALTDPCVLDRDCMSAWIPEDVDGGPDSLQLHAIDGQGNTL